MEDEAGETESGPCPVGSGIRRLSGGDWELLQSVESMRFDYEDLEILTIGTFMLVPQYYLKLLKVLFIRPVILAPLHCPPSGPALGLCPILSLATPSSGGATCPPAAFSPFCDSEGD